MVTRKSGMNTERMARGLGYVSLGLGVAEMVAPRQLQRLLGVAGGRTRGVLRVLGVRETMHGVDILSHRNPTHGVFSRVAGDLLDGALLALAAKKSRNVRGVLAAAAMVLPIVALDMWCAGREVKESSAGEQGERRRSERRNVPITYQPTGQGGPGVMINP